MGAGGFIKNSEKFSAVFLTQSWKETMMRKEFLKRLLPSGIRTGRFTDGREKDGRISGQADEVYVWTVRRGSTEPFFDGSRDGVSGDFSVCPAPGILLDYATWAHGFVFSNVFEKYQEPFPGEQPVSAGHGRAAQGNCADEKQEQG